jgi:hypothetical protein
MLMDNWVLTLLVDDWEHRNIEHLNINKTKLLIRKIPKKSWGFFGLEKKLMQFKDLRGCRRNIVILVRLRVGDSVEK